MSFLWPGLLWLLLLLPLLIVLYRRLLRRQTTVALRYSGLFLLKEPVDGKGLWPRYLPLVLLLLSVGLLILCLARPVAVVKLPTQQQTIILAMDVSASMQAGDVPPNRLTAAQKAAKRFVQELPRNLRVGVVSFAGTAQVAQAPTRNRAEVLAAIDTFRLQPATAIGSAIVVSLATIFPDAGIDVASVERRREQAQFRPPDPLHSRTQEPVPAGSYGSAAIILLTDGQTTRGPDPIDAARMAAAMGVRVFTVGFGTKDGELIKFDGWSMRAELDEDTLRRIADLTLGEYFHAGTARELRKAYESLSARLAIEEQETELTALFADAAAVLLLFAAGLSVWWHGRVA